MISIKKLVSALCLAGCFSYSSAQEITNSGNLINDGNWSGATYGVDPNDCCSSVSGAGALYDTNSNTIKFSYGQDVLAQTIGLQQALGGTGIQVHGYNFSFDYRLVPNNGAQFGMDYLNVDFWLTTSAGQAVEFSSYNLTNATMTGFLDSWMNISDRRTFNNPYLDPQSVTMRIVGQDGGFWAGYYGPEVRNISLSVNYSMDPCAADPLYSPSCPGYWEAFLQQISASSNWNTAVPMSVDTTDAATPDIEIPTITAITEPDPVASSIPGASVDDAATGSAERERREVDPRALSTARDAQNRAAATATAVIQQSQEQSQSMAATQDLARDSVLLSTDAAGPGTDAAGSIGSVIGSTAAGNSNGDSTDMGAARPGDPLSEARNPTAQLSQDNNSNSSTAGRASREPPSELSGGADFGQFAVAPDGFSAYATLVLRDGALYQPREIYQGQKNVDNRRSLQQLSGASDRMHQDMVDQQYRRMP